MKWIVKFSDGGKGLTVRQIEAFCELFEGLGIEATIASEPEGESHE